MKIYNSYEDEPEDDFCALPEKFYCDLYELEMANYSVDIGFYKKNLPRSGSVLEIGCGTGRIAQRLSAKNRGVTGIDISLTMAEKAYAGKNQYCKYICMDMRKLAFTTTFDNILIPYNTLNLLSKKDAIISCLEGCKTHLKKKGTILIQLFIPDGKLRSHQGRMFQFQVFNRPGGGKIIKEVLKKYSADTRTILIEERYRIRPMQEGQDNQNLHHFFTIAGFSHDEWISLFHQAGLEIVHSWGDYDMTPFVHYNSSCFLAILTSLRR